RVALGPAVALPRGDRRREGQGRKGARGVRVPVSGGRVRVRTVPRPPNGLPLRLPGRLRLSRSPLGRPCAAGASRARRARARPRAPACPAGLEGAALPGAGARPAPAVTARIRPLTVATLLIAAALATWI